MFVSTMSSRRVFKTSPRHVFNAPSRHVFRKSSRCLQDAFARRLQIVFARRFQESSRRVEDEKMLHWERVEHIFNTCLEDVSKTSSRPTHFAGTWCHPFYEYKVNRTIKSIINTMRGKYAETTDNLWVF